MSKSRPADYLDPEEAHARRLLLVAWVVALFAVLMGVVSYEAWRILLAIMVMHALAGR